MNTQEIPKILINSAQELSSQQIHKKTLENHQKKPSFLNQKRFSADFQFKTPIKPEKNLQKKRKNSFFEKFIKKR